MRTWPSASQQVEIPTAYSDWKILNTLQQKIYLLSIHIQTAIQFFCLRGPQTLNSDLSHKINKSWIYIHGTYVATGHCRWSMQWNNLCMLTMLCSIQMPVSKARDYISPLTPTTTVLLIKVKLLKCFQEHKGCYFHSCYISGKIISRQYLRHR